MSVRLGLLALLDRADMYGYQLKTAFEAHTGGVWPLNIGQVYTTLGRLERDGLVMAASPAGEGGARAGADVESGDRPGHTYAITDAGRQELADWFADAPTDAPPPRDELIAKVLLAASGDPERALAVVTAQRTALFQVLQGRRRLLRAATRAAESGTDGGDLGTGAGAATGSAAASQVDEPGDAAGDERRDAASDKRRDAAGDQRGATAAPRRGSAVRPLSRGEAGTVVAPPAGDAIAGPADGLARALVLDALVVRTEAELRWLDQCEARLLARRNAGASTRRST